MSRKLSFLDNLIHVKRYSGNLLIKDESVADHTWCMISLAIEYIPELNNKLKSNFFDIREIITGIALHDVEECLTGDIMRPFKYHNKLILNAVKETSDMITLDYLGRNRYDFIKQLTDKSTPEGRLIKILDLAQAGYKMISELQLGNSYFRTEIDNVLDCLNGQSDEVKKSNWDTDIKQVEQWIINEFFNEFKEFIKKYDSKL